MIKNQLNKYFLKLISLFFIMNCSLLFANITASNVIEYTPLGNFPVNYTNANAILGEPATMIRNEVGNDEYITIDQPAWLPSQILTLGDGGHIIVEMSSPVYNLDDPEHLYGIDLIIYGNTLFSKNSKNFWNETSAEPAEVFVSNDLTNWYKIKNCKVDDLFPTQAIDINGNPSDYYKPVNPAYLTNNFCDGTWSYSNTVALYAGAAGGTPIDLSQAVDENGDAVELEAIRYVKIVDIANDYGSAEIDAVVGTRTIPEPYFALISAAVFMLFIRKNSV